MHGRGACMAGGHAWQGDMHGRGPVWWWEACMAGGMCVGGMHGGGGMHGRGCVWWGHVWQGVCMMGGMCGEGGVHGGGQVWQGCVWWRCAWQGASMGRGHVCQLCPHPTPSRYYRIWSMSGKYASYWNAFLFLHYRHHNSSHYPLDMLKLCNLHLTIPLPQHVQTCSLCSPYRCCQVVGWHLIEMPSCNVGPGGGIYRISIVGASSCHDLINMHEHP